MNHSLNIDIKVNQEPVKKIFVLPKETADAFDLYVELSQKEFPGVTEPEVAAAMLGGHMKRDKFFQAELKKRVGVGGKKKDRLIKVTENGHG
jgi:hypothetical protein